MIAWVNARLRTPQHWRWLIFGGFLGVEIALIVVTRLTSASPNGGDLCRDYLDAQRLLHGQDPYAPFAGCGDLHHSPHPPLALLLLVPLALFPIGVAATLWDLLMLAALGYALWMIWDELRPDLAPRWLALILGGLVIWSPLLDTWLEAQIGPLVLLLLVLAWRARRHNHPWAAGAWLAVATLIRLYPVLLFIYPLLRREWRVAGGGIIMGTGLTLLTLPFTRPADYLAYITREAPGSTAEWINDAHNVSWRGWLGQLFIGNNTIYPIVSLPSVVTPLFVLGVLAILAVLIWRGWLARNVRLGAAGDELAWLLALPVMLVISPLTWPHYFDILLLSYAVVGAALWRRGVWDAKVWLLLVALALPNLQSWGLQALLPLPRILPWPTAIFVYALPFYALVLSGWLQLNVLLAKAGLSDSSSRATVKKPNLE
jgi:hypothetical protein